MSKNYTHGRTLYLPIYESVARRIFLLDEGSLELALAGLKLHEIISLFVIQRLSEESKDTLRAELNRVLSITLSPFLDRPIGLEKALCLRITVDGLRHGLGQMPGARIGFMPTSLTTADFQNGDGSFNQEFNHKADSAVYSLKKPMISPGERIRSFTADQNKVIHNVNKLAGSNEIISVEGVAGSGKTGLIPVVFESLVQNKIKPDRIAVIARSEAQRRAVTSVLSDQNTVLKSIRSLLFSDDWGKDHQHLQFLGRTNSWPYQELSVRLGMLGFGRYSPAKLVALARSTIFNFCHSLDYQISQNHLPRYFIQDPDLSNFEMEVLAQYAQKIFDGLFEPNGIEGIVVKPFDYHLIKKRYLESAYFFNNNIDAIVFDESHSMIKPMFSLLKGSFGFPIILLGDPMQDITASSPFTNLYFQDETILRCKMSQSVRSGSGIAELVSPLFRLHPNVIDHTGFAENLDHKTQIIPYFSIPKLSEFADSEFDVLTGSTWGLFEFSHRLKSEKIVFRFSSEKAMRDLAEFYRQLRDLIYSGTRPTHYSFNGIYTRVDLEAAARERQTVRRIVNMFDDGYKDFNFRELEDWIYQPGSAKSKVTMDTVDRLQSQEFSTIIVAPDLTDDIALQNISEMQKERKIIMLNMLYLAVTRAKYRVFVSDMFLQWSKDINLK